jgi:hypothetical protein
VVKKNKVLVLDQRISVNKKTETAKRLLKSLKQKKELIGMYRCLNASFSFARFAAAF